MDLLQPGGPRPDRCRKLLPMGCHPLWVVADMVTKVKAVGGLSPQTQGSPNMRRKTRDALNHGQADLG